MVSKKLNRRSRNNIEFGRRTRSLTEKELGIEPIKKYHRLGGAPKDGYVRFRVTKDVTETDKARLVEIVNKLYWFPKSMSKFGYHPMGSWYAIDVKEYLAIKRGLCRP